MRAEEVCVNRLAKWTASGTALVIPQLGPLGRRGCAVSYPHDRPPSSPGHRPPRRLGSCLFSPGWASRSADRHAGSASPELLHDLRQRRTSVAPGRYRLGERGGLANGCAQLAPRAGATGPRLRRRAAPWMPAPAVPLVFLIDAGRRLRTSSATVLEGACRRPYRFRSPTCSAPPVRVLWPSP